MNPLTDIEPTHSLLRWLRDLPAGDALRLTTAATQGVVRGDRGKGEDLKFVDPAADSEKTETKTAKPFFPTPVLVGLYPDRRPALKSPKLASVWLRNVLKRHGRGHYDRVAAELPSLLTAAGGSMNQPEQSRSLVAEFIQWNESAGSDDVLAFLARHATAALDEQVAVLLVDQARSWRSGQGRKAEDYLAQLPTLKSRPDLIARLVVEEFTYREQRGQNPQPAEYFHRFPDCTEPLRSLFEMRTSLGQSAETPLAKGDSTLIVSHPSQLTETLAQPTSGTQVVNKRIGDYEILGQIARGGMGVVYQARHIRLGSLAAVKLIRSGEFAGEQQIRRFHTEAQSAAQLDHPGIVRVHQVGEQAGQHFLAMAYVDGLSLWQRVKESPLAPKLAARLMQQVAEAVQYAHEKGIIHRDLKPQNILLTKEGQPKVTDFGLAKNRAGDSSLTATGDVLGTPSYMSPEQASGKMDLAGPLADVYSLGATLYCLLTGRPPFQAATPLETMLQVAEQEPVPLRQLNRSLPSDLETICLKCLEKDQAKRYASAAALADDLGRFMRDEPIQARPVSRLEHAWRWCRRNPLVSGLTSAALLLLIAVATVSTLAYVRESRLVSEKDDLITQKEGLIAEKDELITEKNLLVVEERQLRIKATQGAVQAIIEQANTEYIQDHTTLSLLLLAHALHILDDVDAKTSTPRLNGGESSAYSLESTTLGDYIRRRIAAMASIHHKLIFRDPFFGPPNYVSLSPDGSTLLTWGHGHTAQLLEATTGHSLGTLLGHREGISRAVFSTDGKMVATGSYDNTARLWNATTGEPIGEPLQHQGMVQGVAFSPDGQMVLTGSADKTAQLWLTGSGLPLGEPFPHQARVYAVAFSPDGQSILTASDGNVAQVWEIATRKLRGEPLQHNQFIRHIAFSPDGRTVLTGSYDHTACLWDAATGIPRHAPLQHQGNVNAIAFSPNGRMVLTGSADGTALLWDAASGQRHGNPMRHLGSVEAVAFSPDGYSVLTGGTDKTARLWSADTTMSQGEPFEHQGIVGNVAFRPDGKTILTVSSDKTLQLWNVASRKQTNVRLQHQADVQSVAFSPDGKRVVTGSFDSTARLWNATSGEPIGGPFPCLAGGTYVTFSPDGNSIIATTAEKPFAQLYDVTTGKPRGQPLRHRGGIRAIAFSPDGKTILTGSQDHTALLWDPLTGRPRTAPLRHFDIVTSVAYSPDGKRVLTGSHDKTACFWDSNSGKLLGTPLQHQDVVWAVAFSPDGKIALTGSWDHTAQIWDTATGLARGSPLQHQDKVFAATFSPDGTRVLTGSADNTGRLWDAATGEPLGETLRHQGRVLAVAFSSDGKLVMTGSEDKAARLWDANSGKAIQDPFYHESEVTAVAISPDGTKALSGSRDHTARLWRVPMPLAGSPSRIKTWIEVMTGEEFEAGSKNCRSIDAASWKSRRDDLCRCGGPIDDESID